MQWPEPKWIATGIRFEVHIEACSQFVLQWAVKLFASCRLWIQTFRENTMPLSAVVEHVWNAMAHAQKPDLFFQWNGQSPFKSAGASVQLTTGSRGVRISGSNAGYTMFWGSVKSTGYPLHSHVSPTLPLPCVTVCHQVSTELYRSTLADATRLTSNRKEPPPTRNPSNDDSCTKNGTAPLHFTLNTVTEQETRVSYHLWICDHVWMIQFSN